MPIELRQAKRYLLTQTVQSRPRRSIQEAATGHGGYRPNQQGSQPTCKAAALELKRAKQKLQNDRRKQKKLRQFLEQANGGPEISNSHQAFGSRNFGVPGLYNNLTSHTFPHEHIGPDDLEPIMDDTYSQPLHPSSIPVMPYNNVVPVSGMLYFAQRLIGSRDQGFLIHNANSDFFESVLQWIERSCKNCVDDLVFIHKDEFKQHKDNLVKLIDERFAKAYSDFYNSKHREMQSANVSKLQRRLANAEDTIRGLQLKIQELEHSGQDKVVTDIHHHSRHRFLAAKPSVVTRTSATVADLNTARRYGVVRKAGTAHISGNARIVGKPRLTGNAQEIGKDFGSRIVYQGPRNFRPRALDKKMAVVIESHGKDNGYEETVTKSSQDTQSSRFKASPRRAETLILTHAPSYHQSSRHRDSEMVEECMQEMSNVEGEPVYGTIAGYDEAGVFYSYDNILSKVSMRGGAGSRKPENDLEENQSIIGVGKQARLRDLQETSEDKVDRRIPGSWGTTTAIAALEKQSVNNKFAPAFSISDKDATESKFKLYAGYKYSNVAREAPAAPQWSTIEMRACKRYQGSMTNEDQFQEDKLQSNNSATEDLAAQPIAMTFRSASVVKRSTIGFDGDSISSDTDARVEDNSLRVHAEVRENFLGIHEMHKARAPLTTFQEINRGLLPLNQGATIQNFIGGRNVSRFSPKVDDRLRHLGRDGSYLGENRGPIRKRLRRGFEESVLERDEELLRASEEYRYWSQMSPQSRQQLLSIRRKPIEFWLDEPGAAIEDQQEVAVLPEVYGRNTITRSLQDLQSWLMSSSAREADEMSNAESLSKDSGSAQNANREDTIDDWQPAGNFGELDSAVISPPIKRTNKQTLVLLQKLCSPVIKNKLLAPSETSQRSRTTAGSRVGDRPDNELRSWNNWSSTQSTTVSDTFDDIFHIDDTPELQSPQDVDFHIVEDESKLRTYFNMAKTMSSNHGRAVVVRLHQPVKFTPGKVAEKVFGGVIQDIQLHPRERLAIVIFLHPAEARSFIRHVRATRKKGPQQDITALQIEANWYKGKEIESIVPCQEHVLANHIGQGATRALLLHRIPPGKRKEEVSKELGQRLGKLLIRVVLMTPLQNYKLAELGRNAVIEFASIKDAFESREALADGRIHGYTECAAVYATDPSSIPQEEKAYCRCMGCNEFREFRKHDGKQSDRARKEK